MVPGNLSSLSDARNPQLEKKEFGASEGFPTEYYVEQKIISYFLEPIIQRGVPNVHVNSEPMVSRVCVVASQNTNKPNTKIHLHSNDPMKSPLILAN